ncbi:MAG: hypothetical protein QOG51_1257 [Verrucomicrobiota bacterium]|jgi:hypothetical protein
MRAFLVGVVVGFGCFISVARCERVPDNPEYSGRLDSDAWKNFMEHRIRQQAAGDNSALDDLHPTWKEYWTHWYSFLRHNTSGLPWKGSEFRDIEDMIRFIKKRLRAHGLPTYEKT